MKAVFFETAPWERRYLKRVLAQHRLTVRLVAEPLTEETLRLASGAEILSVFIYSTLTARLLRRLPRLRFVATRSTGFDHIDLAACRKRRIVETEALHRILETTVTNLTGFLSGAPVNLLPHG